MCADHFRLSLRHLLELTILLEHRLIMGIVMEPVLADKHLRTPGGHGVTDDGIVVIAGIVGGPLRLRAPAGRPQYRRRRFCQLRSHPLVFRLPHGVIRLRTAPASGVAVLTDKQVIAFRLVPALRQLRPLTFRTGQCHLTAAPFQRRFQISRQLPHAFMFKVPRRPSVDTSRPVSRIDHDFCFTHFLFPPLFCRNIGQCKIAFKPYR